MSGSPKRVHEAAFTSDPAPRTFAPSAGSGGTVAFGVGQGAAGFDLACAEPTSVFTQAHVPCSQVMLVAVQPAGLRRADGSEPASLLVGSLQAAQHVAARRVPPHDVTGLDLSLAPHGQHVCFGGAQFDELYITCGDKVYKRKTLAKGVLAFQPPIKPPAPRL